MDKSECTKRNEVGWRIKGRIRKRNIGTGKERGRKVGMNVVESHKVPHSIC